MSQKAAALKAGYSLTTAMHRSLDNVVDLKTALEVAGLTNRHIADRIVSGVDDEDMYVAHKFIETALKVRGDLTPAVMNNVERMNVVVYLPANPSFDTPKTLGT